MANEALGRGKVKIFPEGMLKKKFLKIYLLGILVGCILTMAVSTGYVILMLTVGVLGSGAIVVIVES